MARGLTIDTSVSLVTEECCRCGVLFAITHQMQRERLDDHAWFYCPNGHMQRYTAKSEAERLRERLKQAQSQTTHLRDQLDSTERSLTAQKGANTKLRKRIQGGVCPCCNRSFVNLARHMQGQHPDYAEEG